VTRSGLIALLLGLLAACSSDNKDDPSGKPTGTPSDAGPKQAAVDTSPLQLGVARPADLAYEWGKGAKPFAPAAAAHKKQDWVRVRSACEETLAVDANHLEAHRLLASALAQQGEYEKAIEHLKIALAGDWGRWGATVLADPDLEPLTSSKLGAALKEMLAAYKAEFTRIARSGLLLVARRAAFKEPTRAKKAGAPARVSTRAEVFAYAVETQRYLRLTQTGYQVLGFLPSPSGDEIAYVAATHVGLPDQPSGPVTLATAQIGMVSLASPETKTPEATIKNARALAVEYLAGDELIVTTYDGQGRWALGPAKTFTIDRADGKTKPTKPPEPAPTTAPPNDAPDDPSAPAASAAPTAPSRRLVVRYETVELEAPGDADGIAADWNPETGTTEEFVIDSSKKRIQLPSGQAAVRTSLTWSPDRARLAFATAADPCAAQPVDRQAALYLVEAESGKLKHVFKGASRLQPRFLGPATLAFEDDQGSIRLYDAAVAREVGRLENKSGLAFVGLGASAGVPCKSEAPAETAPGGAPPSGTPSGAAPSGAPPSGEAGQPSQGAGETKPE
jgi:hypothetical protein